MITKGVRMTATQDITFSVYGVDDALSIVSENAGSVEDGMTFG